MFELPGRLIDEISDEAEEVSSLREQRIAAQHEMIENANKKYYLEECEKLDAYSEELKEGLEREIKELQKTITEKKKEFKSSTDKPLAEMIEMKDTINKLEAKRKKMRRDLYDRQDAIDEENARLQEETRRKLEGNIVNSHIMTIAFMIV